MEVFKKAGIIYTTGFFITSNFEAQTEVLKLAAAENIPLAFNLSATFLIQFNTEQLNACLEYADYIFCNDDEGKVFGEVNKVDQPNGLIDVAKHLAGWKKANEKRERYVFITCGSKPTLAAIRKTDGTVESREVPIPEIAADKIVDTNGAGDSFVGAFLAQLLLGKDI